jgi:hypothetical protein
MKNGLKGLFLLVLGMPASPQGLGYSRPPSPTALQVPFAMSECEGDQCTRGGGGALWVFDGFRGEAMWHYGAVADLTIQGFDGHTFEVDRADPPGTYSSRWAGPDGYFRARYFGTLHGDRIDGPVYFNGDTNHPGTWFATISADLCNPGAACPLGMAQVQQLRQRSSGAGLQQAVATCNRIIESNEQAAHHSPAGGEITPEITSLCYSRAVRIAMQSVENQQVKDPARMSLGALACGVTGVCGDAEHPENMHPPILDSRPATDGAGFTRNDPGSFICQGLFSRGQLHLEVSADGDLASVLTKEQVDQLLQQYPGFIENFKVRPLRDGTYQLVLIPGVGGLTQTYSTQFGYP